VEGKSTIEIEIKIYSSGVNAALNALSAEQSVDYLVETVAGMAIDGDNSTYSSTGTSNPDYQSWMVELDDDYIIKSIVIVKQKCQGESNCVCDLSNRFITLLITLAILL
jgi:hypothetical protein